MKRLMRFAVILLALTAQSAFGSGGMKLPQSTPEQDAINSYNDGLRYRDRAWKYEQELATTQDSAQKAKLEDQIRKTYNAAVRCQSAAVRGNPTMYQAFSELGYALRKSGNYPAALEAYDKSLSMQPNYGQALEYRAEAYLGLDRVNDAKTTYLMLFNGGDSKDAGLLAGAMAKWAADHKANPGTVSAQTIDEFNTWLSQRKEISRDAPSATTGSWR